MNPTAHAQMSDRLAAADPEIADAIAHETRRQSTGLELIASENFVSTAVLEAAGSVLTNKYAEGYPGKRYYGGCEFVDVVESLAISARQGAVRRRARQRAAALRRPGQHERLPDAAQARRHRARHEPRARRPPHPRPPAEFLAASSTRSSRTACGKDDERIDYDELARLADEHKPKMIMVGASAYPRIIDFARIAEVAQRDRRADGRRHGAHRRARRGGVHPSPVPHADFVTTTTHKTLRGPRAGWSSAASATRRISTARCSPACRAGR